MGGDHHHEPTFKIPDYRIYKVENAPKLMDVQRRLAKLGLSDPWLRNEVWRYDPTIWPTPKENIKFLLTRGMRLGIGLTILCLAYEKFTGSGDHHHSSDHH